MAVNDGRERWHLSQEVDRVVEVVFPIGLFRNASLGIEFRECRVLLQVKQTLGKHGHRVGLLRQRGEELDGFTVKLGAFSELVLKVMEFLVRGELASHQQPVERLRQRLVAAFGFLKLLLDVRDRVLAESDARLWVQQTAVIE